MKSDPNHFSDRSALIQVHLSVFLFGFAGLFGKWIELDAISIVWGRVLFASIIFGVYFLVKKVVVFNIKFRTLIFMMGLGALLAFHWWAFFLAIQLSNVSLGLLSFASFPVFTALLEPLYFKTKIQLKTILLVLLSSLGLYIILPEWGWQSDYMRSVFWGVMSGLSFAVLTLFNQKVQRENLLPKEHRSVSLSFYQDFFAFLILSPFVGSSFCQWNTTHWGLIILLGVVFTALAHFLYINGLRRIKATTTSLASNLEPVYGMLLAWLLLGEVIHLKTFLGGVLILSAAFFSVTKFKS
jgi:drug/metabolite transporter (DMT)-like permease